jgi:hypothetical protein
LFTAARNDRFGSSGLWKNFAGNIVLQCLAPEDALKLEHSIFQLLHLGIADHWLVRIHGDRTSLAQEPTPAIQKIWRNSMSPSRRGNGLPLGIAFLDDLQFGSVVQRRRRTSPIIRSTCRNSLEISLS